MLLPYRYEQSRVLIPLLQGRAAAGEKLHGVYNGKLKYCQAVDITGTMLRPLVLIPCVGSKYYLDRINRCKRFQASPVQPAPLLVGFRL